MSEGIILHAMRERERGSCQRSMKRRLRERSNEFVIFSRLKQPYTCSTSSLRGPVEDELRGRQHSNLIVPRIVFTLCDAVKWDNDAE